jgi:hypothetical protein
VDEALRCLLRLRNGEESRVAGWPGGQGCAERAESATHSTRRRHGERGARACCAVCRPPPSYIQLSSPLW